MNTESFVVAFIVAFVVVVVVVTLARRNGVSLAELRTIVAMLVEEAEQTMPGDSGEEKLGFVLMQCERLGVTKWIPAVVLSAAIESAVWRLKRGQQPNETRPKTND